jgi:hypothetical protein
MTDLNVVPRADLRKTPLDDCVQVHPSVVPGRRSEFLYLALRNHGTTALVDWSERLLGRDGR